MQPKLLKSSSLAEFIQAEWNGVNESGYEPLDEIVLVLPDGAAEMTGGGVHLTPDLVERQTMASETGVIVALAEGAFRWNAGRSRPYAGRRPEPGDRVYMQRYSGQVLMGEDGKTYRACSDNCIAAVKARDTSFAKKLADEMRAGTAKFVSAPFPEHDDRDGRIEERMKQENAKA